MNNSKRFLVEAGLLALILAVPLVFLMTGCADDTGGITGVCDSIPPYVVNTFPVADAVGVSLDGNIRATFSEAMDPATINDMTMIVYRGTEEVASLSSIDALPANAIPGTLTYAGLTATFQPSSALEMNTVYTVTISTDAKDISGRGLVGMYLWSFTTLRSPTVVFTVPANMAVDVPLNQNIAAVFSDAMNPATITSSTMKLHRGLTEVSASVSYNGVTASLDPAVNLAQNTEYTATITTGVTDAGGNAMRANYVWTFTTGQTVDAVSPGIVFTEPANRATNVPVNQNIAAVFSEVMDPFTITTSTMTLHQGLTSISGTVSYSGVTATFNPTNPLASSAVFTATVTTGAKDLAGNSMLGNYVWTFTTGNTADITPPTVVFTVPANRTIDVPLNQNVSAVFSEAMDPLTITNANMTLKRGLIPIVGTVTLSGVTATFNPMVGLAQNTVYTATITSGVKDLAGNAIASQYVWTFTTGMVVDAVPPTIVFTVPADGDTAVPLNQNVAAVFSEAMAPATINTSTMTLYQGLTQIAGNVTYSGVTASFNPTNAFAQNTIYTATITTGVKDLAGNAKTSNYVWEFRTGTISDVTPPNVVSTVPVNRAVDVGVNTNISVTFSEALAPATITTATMSLRHGAIADSGTVTYTGVTATYNPTSGLLPSTIYTVVVSTGVRDLAGNAMADRYEWTFTTGTIPDATPPTVVSNIPLRDAVNVALGTNLTAVFSEAMNAGTISTLTMTLRHGEIADSGLVTYNGLTATYNPISNLNSSTVYTATITTGVRDLAGNAMVNNYVWTFTTGDVSPPTVVSTVPVNNAVGVVANSNLTATFSEAMTPATITDLTFTLTTGGNPVAGAVSYAGVVATFNPTNNLASGAIYTATITTGVRDLAGNAMANNYVWTFTTADASPPTVVSTVPVSNAVGVVANSNMTATFSEAMTPATITDQTFTLTTGGNPVAGAVSYAGVVATFNPTNDLTSGAVYTATITTGVRDLAGNAMANAYVWTFTTLDATPPTVVSTVPVNNAVGVVANSNLTATFSEAMTPATISDQTFTLTTGGNPVAGAVSYAGVVATFNPTNDLGSGAVYTAMVTTGVRDLAGNAMANNYVWTFTTLDATPPTVVSTVPVNNAIGVVANSNLTATFSEAMTPATISDQTFTLTTGGNPVAGAVSYAGVVATFNPTNDLGSGAIYTATITTGVRDLVGNAMANAYVWTFTMLDATPPTVVSTVPVNNAFRVDANSDLLATFSELMAPATITDQTFTLSTGGNPVAGAVSYAGVIATFNPTNDLGSGMFYTATITTGVTDLAGNALANNYVWTFTTADIVPPEVVSTSPIDGATGVGVGRTITADFSEVMNPQTISDQTMTLATGGNPIAGVVTYNGVTASFNPEADLESVTEYTVTITNDVTDTSGTAMVNDFVWTFTTGLAAINLRSVGSFAVIAGSTVTNVDNEGTVVDGDLGVSPGAAVTGFPPGRVINGAIHAGDETARVAKLDLTDAYNDAAGRQNAPVDVDGANLGGRTLAPGLYKSDNTLEISAGNLTLDGDGNADAVWIFQCASTLTTTVGRQVILAGEAQAGNIFWQVGTSATLGTNSVFKGTILADQSITITTGARLDGRALTRIGAVTLDTNAITRP